MDRELTTRLTNLNGRLLNLAFRLSFIRKLTKDQQEQLRVMESDLNNQYEVLKNN